MQQCIICHRSTGHPSSKCYHCRIETEGLTSTSLPAFSRYSLQTIEEPNSFCSNRIKGRIAETLIQELFVSEKYEVYSYGIENTVPGLVGSLNGDNSPVAKQLRKMPDFVVRHPETKAVNFIEVKYRGDGIFSRKHLAHDYPYSEAFVVLVSKVHIKCLSIEELRAGKSFHPKCGNYLANRTEFHLSPPNVIDFCKIANKFYEHL